MATGPVQASLLVVTTPPSSPQVLPSPIISSNGPGEDKLFRSQSADVEITTEKERLKKMLSEG